MVAQSGVYKIENLVNGKVYVGSAADIIKRWSVHKRFLRNGGHTIHLQAAWRKYGDSNFKFEILELVEDVTRLAEIEAKWVEVFNANNPCYGYNTRIVVQSNLGMKRSEETRKKLSQAKKATKEWIVTRPDGAVTIIENLTAWCEEHELNASHMRGIADGERKHHHGWKCQRIGPKRELPKRRAR